MKFYLTKAAQLEAEGRAPKAKAAKPAKGLRVPAESTGRRVKSSAKAAASSFAPPTPADAPLAAASDVATAPTASAASGRAFAPTTPATVAGPPAAAPVVAPPAVVSPAAVASPAAAASPAPAASVEAPPARAPKAAKAPKAPKAPKAVKQPRHIIAIGGQPRVDLLPLEVRAERKAAIQVRRAWLGVAAVVVLVGIGGGAATLYSQGAEASLTAAQAQTASLSAKAAQYSKVKTVQGQVDLMDAAREVGGSTDIDWPTYLSKVALTVPTGATLSDLTVDSASSVVAYAQASTPLEGQRIATLTLTATSSSLPDVPTWLDNFTKLPGYVDATAGTVALSDGVYTATTTLHINEKAFSNAYKKGN